MARVLIVGGSLAGLRAADGLRSAGFTGDVVVLSAEVVAPYDRPPLSKQFLAGSWDLDRIALRSAADIDLRLGVRAAALDVANRAVTTTAGSTESADAVVLATGAAPRTLPGGQAVHVIRTVDDSLALQPHLVPGARVAVIGAGFIGSEVASTAAGLGCDVTVVEAAPVPYERALGEVMGRHCASFHERNGVRLITGAGVPTVEERSLRLADGTEIATDVVVAGIGVVPATDWLIGSGLDVTNGVACDEMLRALMTSGGIAPGIHAAGDLASWPNALFPLGAAPERMRVEHWTTAAEMGEHVGHAVTAELAGAAPPPPFAPVPYFWSDQYGVKIQFLGRGNDAEEVLVVDGPDEDGRLLALYRRGDRLAGVLGISKMRVLMGYRALLAAGSSWSEALAHAGC
jgi:NADPH-dependent 2,4-dienoyl-CoA reductase/sulfur reductase-like enzyme